jgi:glutathione synthase/RimK-type ligase-like ATP-grasp enzyme
MSRSKNKKILIITGGKVTKLDSFSLPIEKLGLNVHLASFSNIEYYSQESTFTLKVKGTDIATFGLVYFRLVGKRIEDASLVANYAKEHGVKIIDHVYEKSLLLPSTISKVVEMRKLIYAKVLIPPTFFGSLIKIYEKAGSLVDYPLVIKSTSGRKARDVWLAENKKELKALVEELTERERVGDRFFAQKLVHASQRIRVFVIGDSAVGAITRPTKWRKLWTKRSKGEYPKGKKETIYPVDKKYAKVAINAARAAELDIAGVDILEEDKTGKLYIIEANAAPSWNLIKRYTEVEVEEEILKFLMKRIS